MWVKFIKEHRLGGGPNHPHGDQVQPGDKRNLPPHLAGVLIGMELARETKPPRKRRTKARADKTEPKPEPKASQPKTQPKDNPKPEKGKNK